jgi:hypothetical protein
MLRLFERRIVIKKKKNDNNSSAAIRYCVLTMQCSILGTQHTVRGQDATYGPS